MFQIHVHYLFLGRDMLHRCQWNAKMLKENQHFPWWNNNFTVPTTSSESKISLSVSHEKEVPFWNILLAQAKSMY